MISDWKGDSRDFWVARKTLYLDLDIGFLGCSFCLFYINNLQYVKLPFLFPSKLLLSQKSGYTQKPGHGTHSFSVLLAWTCTAGCGAHPEGNFISCACGDHPLIACTHLAGTAGITGPGC